MPLLPSTLKRAVSVLTLTALLLFAVMAYPMAAEYRCEAAKSALPKYMRAGFALFATGEMPRDAAVIVMLNPNNGDWLILGMDNHEMTCQLLRGSRIVFFVEREI